EERTTKKLSLLLEISKELNKQQELDRLLDKVVDFTFQIMNVDRVSILLLDQKSNELVPRVSKSRTGDASAARHVPQSIAREALVLSNFQRYFAPNLAAQIAQQEGAVQLGGQKRPVVIFFSDIRGFTPMSEDMSPDDIATLLTEYFTEMVEIVFENSGTLDKFMGDAIMALWGAPIAHADDADRAMTCALEQLGALEKMNAKWKAQGRQPVAIGI